MIFLSLYVFYQGVEKEIEVNRLPSQSFLSFLPSDYPVFDPSLKTLIDQTGLPQLSAQGVIIMDNDSKVILYSKNPVTRFAMASTTKIMTAIVALKHYHLNDILEVQSFGGGGAVVGFQKGDKVRFEDMLYGMLLPSGNDAALAIAQNYPGGEQAFIEKMNEKVQELHLTDTHFSDSSGLDDQGDYTTILGLVRIASDALKNPVFARIVATKHHAIKTVDGTKLFPVSNLNQLLGKDGVIGVKTGFTQEAGGILVTAKREDGHTLLILVMKSEDRFADTATLLKLIGGNVTFLSMLP